MNRAVLASHSPTLTTGYGRVLSKLASALQSAGHRVTVVGEGYAGEPHSFPFDVIPISGRDFEDAIGAAIREVEPGVLITLGDPWMFDLVPLLPELGVTSWISYFPIDGQPVPANWQKWISAADVPVVFSKWSRQLVAAATGITPKLIYHGVDTALFRPRDRRQSKAAIGIDPATFVVGCVAMNQQRKNLPALIRAFAAFARGKPDVLLHMHTQETGYWDIPELFHQFDLGERARCTPGLANSQRGVPDLDLVSIYNAFDVFCLPTMAEGFGLPILESQACGVPALATDCSACTELLPHPVQRLRVGTTVVLHRNIEQAIVDEEDITAKLEHFYSNRQDLATLSERCRHFARRFDWGPILREFTDLVRAVPTRPKGAPTRFFLV